MQISLKDLFVFINIVDHGSFTKAAEIMFIAQSSLSKTVQKIERELQTTLFDRSTKKIKLTETGLIFYEKSKLILSTYESITMSINELSNLVIGNLKIGLSPIISTLFFPKIAQVYMKDFPGVTMETVEEGTISIRSKVERGLLDIGFIILTDHDPIFTSTSIYKDRFVLCVPPNHSLASRKTVSFIDLKNEKFILFPKNWALHKLVVGACTQEGFSPEVTFKSAQWDLILELVSSQIGITVIPEILSKKLKNLDIVSIPITNPDLSWNIGVITKENAYHSYALKAFLNVIHHIYKE